MGDVREGLALASETLIPHNLWRPLLGSLDARIPSGQFAELVHAQILHIAIRVDTPAVSASLCTQQASACLISHFKMGKANSRACSHLNQAVFH